MGTLSPKMISIKKEFFPFSWTNKQIPSILLIAALQYKNQKNQLPVS